MMMTRINKIGWWMLMFLVSAAWLTRAEAAPQDFNRLLRGDYAFTGEAVCLVSEEGFKTNFTPNVPGTTWVLSFSIQGVRTFNGDGTGSVVGRTVSVTHPSTAAGFPGVAARMHELSGSFTYSVAPDRTFAVEQGPLTQIGVAGPGTGQTAIIEGINFSGFISQDHKTLVVSTDEPTIEKRTAALSDGSVDVDYRICHRARTAIKIRSPQGRDD